ncbi:uncharacterized protein LOC110114502 [Dendrobium catenatum]|uniref:uncharacterized protein LOC110114502 n=1 Tax=Dendrobium catenatum TaxID=906689 RepID=UPI00109F95BA|nr:uncharacterized protein LOC110114502 [Dendrobium catenatum]XP_020703080.2 uncharacterized protein LOC110114502 [Dendrobium catenatum]
MDNSTGGRDDFFGLLDSFPSYRGFARARSLSSSFFGGRGPFDDPFFTDPFSTHPFRNIMGPSIFENSIFGPHRNPYIDGSNFEFLEDQPLQQHRPSGPIIEEMSDDAEDVDETSKEHEEGPEKILRSGKEVYVQDPTEKSRGVEEYQNYQNELRNASGGKPQTSKYTFHSSTMRYGGIDGTYYTSSTTRRMGGDGVVVEESKEADTSSGRAAHRVSRGIHDKGHSFTRRLNSDGRVRTMQTLHNLNQDELPGFEAAWKGNAGETLMGWNSGMGMHGYQNTRRSNNQSGRSSRVINVEVLPSTSDQIEVSRTGSQT